MLARRLALNGVTVTLLEAGDRLGGSIASHTVGGLVLDAGAESFALRGGTVADLTAELGLGDDIVSPSSAGAWLQPATGSPKPMPALSLMGIPGSPMAADVIAILGPRAAFRAFLETLLPGTYASDSRTIGELVRRRMGAAVLDNLVDPIVRGVYSTDANEVEIDRISPGLVAAMRTRGSLAGAVAELRAGTAGQAKAGSAVAGIRGGMFRLIDALADDARRLGVDIRLGARVTDVAADQVSVGSEQIAGRVSVAAPGLLGGAAEAGPLAVLATLVLDEPRLDRGPRGTGLLVAEGARGIRARALTHATAKWPWLAEVSGGKHVVRLSYASALDNHRAVAMADASALLGVEIGDRSVVDFAVVEWRRPPRQADIPAGISLVGETASGTGMAAVVARSEAEAQALLRTL